MIRLVALALTTAGLLNRMLPQGNLMATGINMPTSIHRGLQITLITSLLMTYLVLQPLYAATQEASDLVTKIITADREDKETLFEAFKTLVNKHPENIYIRRMFINSLLAEGHYEEGLNQLDSMEKGRLTRVDLLTRCMVRERISMRDEKCYQDVIAQAQKTHSIDSDYITAVFFTDLAEFERLKTTLIKENKFTESDFLIFSLGRETLLHEIYP